MTANQRLDPDGRPQPHDELPRGAPQTTLESAELRVECALLKERQGGLLENTFMRPTGALVRQRTPRCRRRRGVHSLGATPSSGDERSLVSAPALPRIKGPSSDFTAVRSTHRRGCWPSPRTQTVGRKAHKFLRPH